MFYSRGSRKVRIFKGGSHIDYSAWEFILNDTIDKDGDGIADREDPDLTDGPAYQDSDGDGIVDSDDPSPNQIDQTISWSNDTSHNLSDGSFSLGASSTSGLTLSYTSSNTSIATVNSSGLVTLISGGTFAITMSAPANTDYFAASLTTPSITVVDNVTDSDNDGVLNKDDAFPNDPDEQTDSDGDGIGDNEQAKIETFIHKHWGFYSNRYVASVWDGFEYDLKLKTSNVGHANIPLTCVSTSSNERDTWGPNPEGKIYTGVYGSWSTPPMVSVGADSEITFSIDPIYSSIASIRDGRYFQATGATGSFILVAHYPGDATHRSVTQSWTITAT